VISGPKLFVSQTRYFSENSFTIIRQLLLQKTSKPRHIFEKLNFCINFIEKLHKVKGEDSMTSESNDFFFAAFSPHVFLIFMRSFFFVIFPFVHQFACTCSKQSVTEQKYIHT